MKRFAPLLVLSFGYVLSAEEAVRTWTDLKGRTMEARFIKFSRDKIVLRREDEKSFNVSPAIFSMEDQNYIESLLKPPVFFSRNSWTHSNGQSINAKFISCDGNFVKVEKDGNVCSISVDDLDKNSRDFALSNRHYDLKTEKNFVEKVCFFNETGSGKGRSSLRGYLLKWTKSPKLSLQSLNYKRSYAPAIDLNDLGKISFAPPIHEINQVLQGSGIQIELLPPDQQHADIKVYFASRDKDFRFFLQKNGIPSTGHIRSLGACFYPFEVNGEITKAIIIFRDMDLSRGLILQEVTQVLGPTNDSSLIKKSIFNGDSGILPEHLTSIDRGILRFVYNHCKPGENLIRFRKMFDEHWSVYPR